ncbi:McrB family protein [Marinomonas sp. TW1]|uniref:McrB family protein n=1 Tax=Marinomonas sp. TW1 TaxID=1561203 RepID=UPI0007AF2665|nr:AAA family ATPase [Marinomonas sp. TW1]
MARDYSKYQFNGQKLGKNRLVLEVIKQYVDDQNPTYKELLDTFSADIQGSRGLFIEKSKYDALPEDADDKKQNRYFKKVDEVIALADRDVLVTTQWGVDNIARFIKKAKSLGFDISESTNSYDDVYWFLGASYGGDDDQTERFLRDGIWQNGTDGKFTDKVKEIRRGDKIAIKSAYTQTHGLPFDNKGKISSVMDIKAVGVVTENLNDGKTLKVDWQTDFKKLTWYIYQPRIWKVIPNNKERKALVDFTFNGARQDFSIFVNSDDEFDGVSMPSSSADLSLNTILYGPPGTGKTYHSIQAAVKAAEPEIFSALGIDERTGATPEQRAELTRLYKELYNTGRIKFVTFHQSYGYEEFVEGLSAKTEGDQLSYFEKDGVFKSLCLDAKEHQIAKTKTVASTFEDKWQGFSEELAEADDGINIDTLSKKTYFTITDITNNTIRFDKSKGASVHSLSVKTLRAVHNGEKEIIGGLQPYYGAVIEYLNRFKTQNDASKKERKNFVLIIDEINRGNISKIFGELITLIEPSKRLGQSEAIEVTLPYSGDKFSVPDNFYIIGTMNTADRSLALMDTALRRRFDFVEMMPDYNVLRDEERLSFSIESEDFEIDLTLLLQTLNKRITALYDREHQLGHAFLMPAVNSVRDGDYGKALNELKNSFQNKVIPLLAEYFFEDWQKIRLVLGDNQKPDAYQLIKQSDVDYEVLFGDTEDVGDVADNVQDYRLIEADSKLWANPLTYIGIYSADNLPKGEG